MDTGNSVVKICKVDRGWEERGKERMEGICNTVNNKKKFFN